MANQPSGDVPCKVVQQSRNVFQATIPLRRVKDWESWLLLSGDRHWDNPHSNHKLQRKHLDQALERNARILDIGDLLCLMQGKYDPRSSKSSVRPEHQVDNYIDAVVRTAADFFAPYAQNFIAIAQGNHETSILKRLETNVIDRLTAVLNHTTGSSVYNGGFSGWVRLLFTETGSKNKYSGRQLILHYDHGYGGGGPVTADVIQHQRRSVYLPDADIVVSGHTHDSWAREIVKLKLTKTGEVRQVPQWHIKCPTYKDEYADGYAGWAVERGSPPKPLGAYWLRFYWDNSEDMVKFEVIKAS